MVRRDTIGFYRLFHVLHGVSAAISGLTLTSGNITIPNGFGGAIFNEGTLQLSHCTLSGNTALAGGGIANLGQLTLSNFTLFDNTASSGGGVGNEAELTVINSTLCGNTAD